MESDEEPDWEGEDEDSPVGDPTEVIDPVSGLPRLCREMCGSCILRPAGEALRLRPGRLKQFLDDVLAQQSFVVCHSSIYLGAPSDKPAICRGFYDRFGERSQMIRVWHRLGGKQVFRLVDVQKAES